MKHISRKLDWKSLHISSHVIKLAAIDVYTNRTHRGHYKDNYRQFKKVLKWLRTHVARGFIVDPVDGQKIWFKHAQGDDPDGLFATNFVFDNGFCAAE